MKQRNNFTQQQQQQQPLNVNDQQEGKIRVFTSGEGRRRLLQVKEPTLMQTFAYYGCAVCVYIWQVLPWLLLAHMIYVYIYFHWDLKNKELYKNAIKGAVACTKIAEDDHLFDQCPLYNQWASTTYEQNILRETFFEHGDHLRSGVEWLVSAGGRIQALTNWCEPTSTCRFLFTQFVAQVVGSIWLLLPCLFIVMGVSYVVFGWLPAFVHKGNRQRQRRHGGKKKPKSTAAATATAEARGFNGSGDDDDDGNFSEVEIAEHQKPPAGFTGNDPTSVAIHKLLDHVKGQQQQQQPVARYL